MSSDSLMYLSVGSTLSAKATVTPNEKTAIAKTSNPLFPIGFYNLTSSKRGVTRGRGPWSGRETLCLLHCSADKSGCKYKARYCRTGGGVEIWSSGEHDSEAHQSAKPKRGLTPEARAIVTKNHHLGQVQLQNLLLEQGLIPADSTKEELKKIKRQIKRRRLTVKDQMKGEKLVVASMVAEKLEKEREMERANVAAVDMIVAADNALAREEREKKLEQIQQAEEDQLVQV